MLPGIRATVEFASPDICPIVELSDSAGTTIESAVSNVRTTESSETVTEFSVEADGPAGPDLTPIFSDGSITRYRYTHTDGVSCPCECLGEFGCPVDQYVAQKGTLTIEFYAANYEELKQVVATLRTQFPDSNIKRFIRSPAGATTRDTVMVDRSKLTPRQREVLKTAYERGYFERPRRANATEIAADLDISLSTFSEHVAAAETKLLEDLFS